MERTREKDSFKTVAVILAAAIVVVLVGGVLLLLFSGRDLGGGGSDGREKTALEVVTPAESAEPMAETITLTAKGAAAGAVTEEQTNETESAGAQDRLSGDYVIPDSATRLLTSADVAGLSAKELSYARNEIFARHGRRFKSQELQKYFEGKSWYEGKYDGDDFDANYSANLLTETEKKNAEFLKAEEAKAGGYKLS